MYYTHREKTDVTNLIIVKHIEVKLNRDNEKVYKCKICGAEITYGKKHVREHYKRHHFELYLKYLRELKENEGQISIKN